MVGFLKSGHINFIWIYTHMYYSIVATLEHTCMHNHYKAWLTLLDVHNHFFEAEHGTSQTRLAIWQDTVWLYHDYLKWSPHKTSMVAVKSTVKYQPDLLKAGHLWIRAGSISNRTRIRLQSIVAAAAAIQANGRS